MDLQIIKHHSLALQTTLHIGGEAEYFTIVRTEEALSEVAVYAREHELPITILGSGSNVLVADEGLRGLVVHIALTGMAVAQEGDIVLLTAKAGELLDDVVSYTVQNNWWGIENLSHIPGTVGATPIQNVGAYGTEIKDVLQSVRVYNIETNTFEVLTAEECKFGYRDSIFKTIEGKKYIVTEVTYTLSKIPKPKLSYRDLALAFRDTEPTQSEIREAVIRIRSQKFPDWNTVGTAGSFFKNPIIPEEQYQKLMTRYPELPGFVLPDGTVKLSLGWILDKVLDLKGYSDGLVGSYPQQALVLVTQKNATAREVLSFSRRIIERIKNEMDVSVELEVTYLH